MALFEADCQKSNGLAIWPPLGLNMNLATLVEGCQITCDMQKKEKEKNSPPQKIVELVKDQR